MLELLLLSLVGCVVGFVNVMAGGGSMLSVPVMIFLGLPGAVANGTNRIGILPQNMAAIWAFYRKGYANFGFSLSLALCTLPGTYIGAMSAIHISSSSFNYILAVIMAVILIIMALPSTAKEGDNSDEPLSTQRLVLGHLLMVGVGFWGGFIHIGVGFILMPILHRVLLFDLITTNSHKVFIVFVYSIMALLVFATQLELVWSYGIALAIGTASGAWVAAHYQVKRGVGVIKLVLNVVIVIFIAKLLLMR